MIMGMGENERQLHLCTKVRERASIASLEVNPLLLVGCVQTGGGGEISGARAKRTIAERCHRDAMTLCLSAPRMKMHRLNSEVTGEFIR